MRKTRNADNIQDVMGEVEETAEEESIPVSVNLNESLEADEEENDMEVEVNSNTTAIEQDEEEKQPDVRKETVIKPIVAKKYQPSAQEKSISKLQDQLNRHFDKSKKTEDILKQIEQKMTQIDKIVIVSNKQHALCVALYLLQESAFEYPVYAQQNIEVGMNSSEV